MCHAGMHPEQNPQVLPEAWSFLFAASQLSPSQKAVAFSLLTCYQTSGGNGTGFKPLSQEGEDGFCHFSVTREGEPLSPTTQTTGPFHLPEVKETLYSLQTIFLQVSKEIIIKKRTHRDTCDGRN